MISVPQTWQKQGLIFKPPQLAWMCTHAALPVAEQYNGSTYRVYFSGRDEGGRSHIGNFRLTMEAPPKPPTVHHVSMSPVLSPGSIGAFDDSGVTVSWIIPYQQQIYLYYSGWSLGVTVPFYFYIGLAISDDGGETFHRVSPAPILERNSIDPYLTASPCILIEQGIWRMWYVSCTGWKKEQQELRHFYHIRYAESCDGIYWKRDGHVCIDFASEDEYAFSRPSVIHDKYGYHMWYSYRGDTYQLGYAESTDGLIWKRKDHLVGLSPSPGEWDSDMLAYPYVFEHENRRFLLYNGNGYGKTGIGLACQSHISEEHIL